MNRQLRPFALALVVSMAAVACGSGDDAGLFDPAAAGGKDGGVGGGISGSGGTDLGGSSGEGGAGGGGESGNGGVGGESGNGGSGGDSGAGGSGGEAGGGGEGGSGGTTTLCEYKAFSAWELDKLANMINADIASGWGVHSLFARPENNGGSAEPNVVWLTKGGNYYAIQDFSAPDLAEKVSDEVAGGAEVRAVLARPHGSSVEPEVGWLKQGGAFRAYEKWLLTELQKAVNADVGSGFDVFSLHARSENNSGSAKPNVVWLHGANGYLALQDFSVTNLAALVGEQVSQGYEVHTILARPHGSSVPPEVGWLQMGNSFQAFAEWTQDALAAKVNVNTANGWSVIALRARGENNSGAALPNVVWLQQGTQFKALQAMSLEKLAASVNTEVANGWGVHTIQAREHGSSVPPEVAWLKRCE